MKHITWYITILLLFSIPMAMIAQLSPGPLTSAHAELEGLANCTQCHDIGNKVPDRKCLDCHDEIATLLNDQRGYHASPQVVEKTCIDCHSEHHGRKFEMSRFDESTFDHNLTGYKLQGEHAMIECRDCHQTENITNPDIRSRSSTFLGLETACLSCHDDFHQNTLSSNCIDCHNFDVFRPARGFDHEDAAFVLRGSHQGVDCIECHPMELKNGVEFQVFKGIEFNACVSCHDDAHRGHLSFACTQCHTETSFKDFIGQKRFNHSKTNFNLKGSHREISCFECHEKPLKVSEIFQDTEGIQESNCVACHEDVHDGKFGTSCVDCHTETSFHELKNMDLFDHGATDFPLVGLHQEVDCQACHTTKYSDAIDFALCRNCHDDYHQGEFIKNNSTPDCAQCHRVEQAFSYTSYGLVEHQQSSFPLDGSHEATPCFACHVSEEKWSFRNIGSTCVDCHDDIHEGFISETFYPDKNCIACHTTNSWADITFDHSSTEWPLEGGHQQIACANCHISVDELKGAISQTFNNLSQDCMHCHDNPHGSQFEERGTTTCSRCHTAQDWSPSKFDHSRTSFSLDGQHAEIECRACHKAQKEVNGNQQTDFRIESFECIDCHG